MKFKQLKGSEKNKTSLREKIGNINVAGLSLKITCKMLKYLLAGTVGAFVVYCCIKDDFKLSGSTAFSLKGDGVNVTVTRQEIKDYLEESDRQAILNMVDLKINEEFLKDVPAYTDEDIEKIDKYYDAYVEETYGDKATFNAYRKVYKLSDDYIRRCMVINIKKEKRLNQLERSIKIDSDSLKTEWDTNKESYQYVICDAVIFRNVKTADEFYEKAVNGEVTAKDAEELKTQIGYDEKIYFNDSRLQYSLSNKYGSDVIYAYTSDGYPIILFVSDRKVNKKDLTNDMKDSLRTINAQDKYDAEFNEFEESLDIYVESDKVENR